MPAGFERIGGYAGAADALQQILFQREQAKLQAAKAEEERMQRELVNARATRSLDLESEGLQLQRDRMNQPTAPKLTPTWENGVQVLRPEAPGLVLGAPPPKPTEPKAPIRLPNMRGRSGGPATQFLDPDTFSVLSEFPEYQAPPKPTGSGQPQKDLANLARQAAENPAILDGMSPTDRTKVMTLIANSGELRTVSGDNARRQLQETLDSIADLRKTTGASGAIGTKSISSLFGLLERPIAGSSESDFRNKFDQVKSRLTLPRLQALRGLGAMSNIEFEAMQKSGSALDPSLSEDYFWRELTNIEEAYKAMLGRNPGAQGGNAPRTYTGEVRQAADGRTIGNVNGQVVEVVKSPTGGWVIK